VPAVAIGVIAVFTVVNLVGTRTGTAVQGALTVIKVSALVILILAVFTPRPRQLGEPQSRGRPC
jgi:amino acid transporter